MLKQMMPILVFLFVFPSVALASNRCLDSSTMESNSTYYIDDGTSTTALNISKPVYCPYGCSSTLNACRMDTYNEAMFAFGTMGGILVFCILSLYISAKTETGIYVIMLVIASVLSIVITLTDVFSTIYRTIFLAFSFVPGLFILFAYRKWRDERKENPLILR